MKGSTIRLADLPRPDSAATRAAAQLIAHYARPALANHALRSAAFASCYGLLASIEHDPELLEVASLLHDLGLESAFDNHTLAFEDSSGHLATVFAAGSGWDAARTHRLGQAIRLHMTDHVDPGACPEGHLLEQATGMDITGRNVARLPSAFLAEVAATFPRLDLAEQFGASFREQATRKPGSAAAAAVQAGLLERLERFDSGVTPRGHDPGTEGAKR